MGGTWVVQQRETWKERRRKGRGRSTRDPLQLFSRGYAYATRDKTHATTTTHYLPVDDRLQRRVINMYSTLTTIRQI